MTFNILAHLAKAEIGKMWFVRVSNDDASLLHFNANISERSIPCDSDCWRRV